ncbi:hypothetical protein O6H91_06G051600 [Diphasiastrum complanatum]|uniref:Uncharacterized protein n=1 Tax=Diphasiastrum complanatum TaxID=34168 RepID=A0ACC2DE13_DIPCM|nr:hypothetical protein O6H91_06G051600 [Diphasiastrum complanatum]
MIASHEKPASSEIRLFFRIESSWYLQTEALSSMASSMLRRNLKHGSGRLFRFTFRSFVFLLLFLTLLAVLPSIILHSRLRILFSRGGRQECVWLQGPPLVCAHGGDSSRAPPNTLLAYKLALDAKVDCIEVDVSRTRDGVLVALHDRDLQKFSMDQAMHVGELTIKQIKALSVGLKTDNTAAKLSVPTLEETLMFISRHVKEVIIDAKVGPPLYEENLAVDIMSVVKRTSCKNCLMWSKLDNLVMVYQRLYPEALTGYIVMNDTVTGQATDLLRMKEPKVVGVYHGLVNKELVAEVKRKFRKDLLSESEILHCDDQGEEESACLDGG